jgi:sugar phosphate isomerase/epimerase
MKLGIGSYLMRWAIGHNKFRPSRPLQAVDLIHVASDLGADLLQYADNMPLHPLSTPELDNLRQTAAAKGIELEVGTSGCRADRLQQNLDIAQRLEAPLVRLVLDAADAHPSTEEAIAILRDAAPAYRRARVKLAIENHFLMTSPVLSHVVESVGDEYVGVCLDTANSVGCGEWPLETVRMLLPYANNLHLKDYVINPHPDGVGVVVSGAPFGTGRQEIDTILKLVRGTGRDMNVILEQWLPQGRDEAETLARELEWARGAVTAARRFMAS